MYFKDLTPKARLALLTVLLSGAVVVTFGAQGNTRSQLPAGLKVGSAFPAVLAKTTDRHDFAEVVPSGSAAWVVFFHPT